MDSVTLALAKAYTDSQRLAYSEWGVSLISFDGDIVNRDAVPGEALGLGGTFVYASDEVISGGTVRTVDVYAKGTDGKDYVINAANPVIRITDDGIGLVMGKAYTTECLAISFGSDIANLLSVSPGTYVWTDTVSGAFCYVGSIHGNFTETIHPIDPKFLPAGDDNILDLDELGIDFVSMVQNGGGTAEYTDKTAVDLFKATVAKEPKYAKYTALAPMRLTIGSLSIGENISAVYFSLAVLIGQLVSGDVYIDCRNDKLTVYMTLR